MLLKKKERERVLLHRVSQKRQPLLKIKIKNIPDLLNDEKEAKVTKKNIDIKDIIDIGRLLWEPLYYVILLLRMHRLKASVLCCSLQCCRDHLYLQTGAPIGAWKCIFPVFWGNYARPTNQPTNQLSDKQRNRRGHREVTLPIKRVWDMTATCCRCDDNMSRDRSCDEDLFEGRGRL